VNLDRLDHLVLTVASAAPTPGGIDLCLIATTPLDRVREELVAHGVAVIEGPVDAPARPARSVVCTSATPIRT
jgi:hypothetical protein